jgi:hypothetical protein
MIKKISKFIIYLIGILLIFIIYLSVFGFKTDRFNSKINDEVLKVNKRASIKLKTIKIILKPKNLTFEVQTKQPIIYLDNQQLLLESIKTSIPIISFVNNDFAIDDLKILTKEIKITDIILLIRSFKDSAELFLLDRVVKDGFLVGDIDLNFDENGKIKNNFVVNGFIKDANFSVLKKYNISNTNLLFKIKNKELILEKVKTKFNKINFSFPFIKIKEEKNIFLVDGKILSDEKDINIKKVEAFFDNIFKNYNIEDVNFDSESNFSFNIDGKFKINDLKIKSKINLNKFKYKADIEFINKYIPYFKNLFSFENHEISINYEKDKLDIKGKGKVSIENKTDIIKYELIKNKDDYIFNTSIDINQNYFLIEKIKYKKDQDLKAKLILKGVFKKDKKIIFDLISLTDEQKNFFLIKNLSLGSGMKIDKISFLDFSFTNYEKIKNQISLKKNTEKYIIRGKVFDASKLIDDTLESEKKSSQFLDEFDAQVDIKIDQVYLDSEYFIIDTEGSLTLVKGEINKLNIKSNFENNKKLTMTINTTPSEKITTLYSSNATPFVKRYKFIKGFQDGSLDFSSTKKNNITTAQLKIYDFKLLELPALTKLLSLASLQGIADILTGEGIRFDDFEMSYEKNQQLISFSEIYAIGPAISILMNGYVDSDKIVSLRGTLVPATTINKAIGSIPILGKILVGNKTGEGVFGVSFKIKGPPKNLRTTVNPIKTLTPRFITRTLEKIKKN